MNTLIFRGSRPHLTNRQNHCSFPNLPSSPFALPPPPRNGGFTLVEILIVIAIIGILAAVGIPSFRAQQPNLNFRDASRNLLFDLQKAKMEAMKRNAAVSIKFSPTAKSCEAIENDITSSGSFPNNARGNYVIFIDSNSNGSYENGTDITINLNIAMPEHVALCKKSDQTKEPFPTNDLLTFKANGLPDITTENTIGIINSVTLDDNITVNLIGKIALGTLPD